MRHLFVLAFVCLIGCAPRIPRDALILSPDTLQLRQLQTRVFDTTDEKWLLSAAVGVMQDLGFNLDEATPQLGILVGSKTRDATNYAQIASRVFAAAILGQGAADIPVETLQTVRISIVTKPIEQRTALRVTFQRIVYGDRNEVLKTESLEDPALYQEFFSALSKAVFLRANNL